MCLLGTKTGESTSIDDGGIFKARAIPGMRLTPIRKNGRVPEYFNLAEDRGRV